MADKKPKIAFFGTPELAVWVLEALYDKGVAIDLVIAAPDAPKGRKLVLTPPPAKVWAEANDIFVLQPENIRSKEFERELREHANKGRENTRFPVSEGSEQSTRLGSEGFPGEEWDLFIVAAYGKLIPENILYMPKAKTINVHPSLLPLLRGSSPIQSAILADMRDTGVTIMRLDKEMDHGPILAQKKSELDIWPVDQTTLGKHLATEGAGLIADLLPDLLAGKAAEKEQDHSKATFTKKISKSDGEIDLGADGYSNYLKYNAYKGWPGTFFFVTKAGKKLRVSIASARYDLGAFAPERVIPEGKKEMSWSEFEKWRRE